MRTDPRVKSRQNQGPTFVRRSVISVREVQAAAKNGRVIQLGPGAIVTPAAVERAKELGVLLQSGTALLKSGELVELPVERLSGDLSEELLRFSAALPPGSLPSEIIETTKTLLLDTLAVGLAASGGAMSRQLLAGSGESGKGRVIGSRRRLLTKDAAFVNGALVHLLEFDPTFDDGLIHPMAGVVPAALAAADERPGTTGIALLSAIAVGVEAACRASFAATKPPRFYRCGAMAALGGTVAAARIFGLSVQTSLDAVGIAMSQGPVGWQAHDEGSAIHGALPGLAASNAIHACHLAAAGIAGPSRALEGPDGYFATAEDGAYDRRRALDGIGERWLMSQVGIKPFPSGRLTHGAIVAALELREENGLRPEDIRRIDVSVSGVIAERTGRVPSADAGIVHQRLSLPFVVAQAFLYGAVGVGQFGPDRAADPVVQNLLGRTYVAANSAIPATAFVPVTMRVELNDGRFLERTVATLPGGATRPLTREQHHDKVRTCAALSPLTRWRKDAELIRTIESLDTSRSTRALWAALAPG
jgi:2-methylcitrate dehydratase PrpD